MWQNWINALLGLWVIAVGFMGMTGGTLTWTLAITGVVIAVLSLWSASMGSEMGEMGQRHVQHQ